MKGIQTFLTVVVSMAIGAMVVGGITWAVNDDDDGAPAAVLEQNDDGAENTSGSSPAVIA